MGHTIDTYERIKVQKIKWIYFLNDEQNKNKNKNKLKTKNDSKNLGEMGEKEGRRADEDE